MSKKIHSQTIPWQQFGLLKCYVSLTLRDSIYNRVIPYPQEVQYIKYINKSLSGYHRDMIYSDMLPSYGTCLMIIRRAYDHGVGYIPSWWDGSVGIPRRLSLMFIDWRFWMFNGRSGH